MPRSGDWMEDFVREVKQDSFDFNAYLGEYREFAKVLNESHGS
jgi:hypothetical protein